MFRHVNDFTGISPEYIQNISVGAAPGCDTFDSVQSHIYLIY